MDKEGRWVESNIYDARRVSWTNNNVLWANKFPSHFPDNNKWNPKESNQH